MQHSIRRLLRIFSLLFSLSSTSLFAQASGPLLWSDTSLSLLPYGRGFRVDPNEQSTLTIEHAHESKIGDLFLFVDFTQFRGTADGVDDTTWYGEFGPRLSFGKLSGRDREKPVFEMGAFAIRDALLALQYERGQHPDVAEAALVGLGLDLDTRKPGLRRFNYVQLNVYGRAEMIEGVRGGFRDVQVTTVASLPFKVGRTEWLLDGYSDWVLGVGSRAWTYHLNPQLTVDLGALAGEPPKKLYAGIEMDLWWNKYQIPNSRAFDTNQRAVSLLLKYHF